MDEAHSDGGDGFNPATGGAHERMGDGGKGWVELAFEADLES